jgi:Mg/Co/Ni transporter MgtE
VLGRIGDAPYGFALVLGPAGVLLGRIRRSALETAPNAGRIEAIVEPGPSTIRPHLPSDELRERLEGSAVRTLVLTTPGGVLLGVVRRDDIPT